MAKKATGKSGSGRSESAKGSRSRAVVKRPSSGSGSRRDSEEGMGDAFIKLLQSPLVADLLAVAATAALAALAEHGFSSRGAGGAGGKRAGKAAKEAGKAAAAAIGRRLGTEMEEIRAAAKKAKAGAGA